MIPRVERVAQWAQARSDHPAILQLGSDRPLTYGELWARSQSLASKLQDLEMGQSPVAVVTRNAGLVAVAELAIEIAGGVVAPLAPDLAAGELLGMLQFIETCCLIGPVAPEVVAQVPTCAAVLADGVHPELLPGHHARPSYDIPARWAAFMGTSGTTARPKVPVHTTASRLANDAPFEEDLGPDDVLVSGLAPTSDYLLRRTLNTGGTYISSAGSDRRALALAVNNARATIVAAIPWIFKQWAAEPELKRLLHGLRRAIHHGYLPTSDVEILFNQIGCVTISPYGMAEIGGVTSMMRSWIDGEMDTVGRARSGVEMRLVAADGHAVADGEPGELWVRWPGVMEGYLKDPEQAAAVMEDSWFRTGDVMTRDADGYYRIVGRVKSMISVAGRKVYAEEVETVLLDHPAVQQAVVFPAGDPVRGERVEAEVVLVEGLRVTQGDLRAFCRNRLTAYKVPRTIRFVPSLPTTRYGRTARPRPQGGNLS